MLALHGRVSAWYAAHRIRIMAETATGLTLPLQVIGLMLCAVTITARSAAR